MGAAVASGEERQFPAPGQVLTCLERGTQASGPQGPGGRGSRWQKLWGVGRCPLWSPAAPACPQEHPERLLGASGHLGAEPRAAAQVHHAGHGHHAQAGEAACVPGRPGLGAVHSQLGWDGGPPGVAISSMRGPPPQLEGALDFGFWASYSSPIPHRQVPGLKVLSSQGPRVEILAKNLRIKDQMPQGAPR